MQNNNKVPEKENEISPLFQQAIDITRRHAEILKLQDKVTKEAKPNTLLGEAFRQANLILKLSEYVKKDLRRRFDDAGSVHRAIGIIDEAKEFGFTELAEEMIYDLCMDDDAKRLYDMIKNRRSEDEVANDLMDRFYENDY